MTLTVTDTGGLVSNPVTKNVTVSNTPPPDAAPVGQLATRGSTTSLTATADATGSTDTDSTPIASYTFDFGAPSTPVPTSKVNQQHP